MKLNMRKVLAVLAALATLCAVLPLGSMFSAMADDTNLIANGDFSAGIDGWYASGGTTIEGIKSILETFAESDDYGMILRAKGIVECECGKWIHFDYVPGEPDVRLGSAGVIGRLCVIGAGIDKEKIKELFGI